MQPSERDGDVVDCHDEVKVWDAPTRIFHWTLVCLVALSWFTADRGLMKLHLWSGIGALVLLMFRIAWGIVGSTTARFGDFVATPRSVLRYLAAQRESITLRHAGHNPAGGWMVVTLITLLSVQVLSGLMGNDDLGFNGPLAHLVSKDLSDRLTGLHGVSFNLLLVLIWLHVVAVLFYRFVKGEDLLRSMFTGTKPASQVPPGARLKFEPASRALLLVVLSIALVTCSMALV